VNVPRKTAGRKYPHVTTDAKPHNHQFCPVVSKIVELAAAGDEEWGTIHEWHVTAETDAKNARTGFYAARYCRSITARLGEPVSVQANYEPDDPMWKAGKGKSAALPTTWRVWVRVWPRSVAKKEIARRVKAGEQLAYNVTRR
jgi:hypothetical protein